MTERPRPDLERYQRKAAELVLEDESWRDGLEDRVAAPLLDWALQQTDAAIARAAARGADLDAVAYDVAARARRALETVAQTMRQASEWDSA